MIARNIRSRPNLEGCSVAELYSTAVTGDGYVGGAINAILLYRHRDFGVAAFSHYLARAVTNALLPKNTREKAIQAMEAQTFPLGKPSDADAARKWTDRATRPPEAAVIDRELLAVVRSVIPLLPTAQQRDTATWLIERILTTGELPTGHEAARMQRRRVVPARGRQILAATVNNIQRLIEEEYPQLAEHGVNGWEDFKMALARPCQIGPNGRARNGCG